MEFPYAELAEWIGEETAEVAAALRSVGGSPESVVVEPSSVVSLGKWAMDSDWQRRVNPDLYQRRRQRQRQREATNVANPVEPVT
jgi:hypothetical protein